MPFDGVGAAVFVPSRNYLPQSRQDHYLVSGDTQFCLVVSVFKGVILGWAFEQSIRGRPALRANGIHLQCGGLRARIP